MGQARSQGVGLLLMAAAAPWIGGCSSSPARTESSAASDAPPPSAVRVVRPELVAWEDSYPSSLYVERDVRVRARRSGIIVRIHADRGERVREGQVLAQLETDVATAELAMAEQEQRMAEVEYDSKRSLRDQDIISPNDFMKGETARDLARSRTDLARNYLERCNVRAPFDGIVAERWAQVGRRVEEDETTPLFRIVALDPPRAKVDVPEDRLKDLAVGVAATIEASGYETPVPARVVFVSPAVDPSSGTAPVIVEAQAAGGMMRPGASARVRFQGLQAFRHEAFRVPREAAPDGAEKGTEASMLVVNGAKVALRRVRIVESHLGSVLVTGEIASGDRVILGPRAGLEPGDPVVATEEGL